jgi:hypothetical protein
LAAERGSCGSPGSESQRDVFRLVGVAEIDPLEWRQVRRSPEEKLFRSMLAEHHYLGAVRAVGEHLQFLVLAGGRPIACFAWFSPPHKLIPHTNTSDGRQRRAITIGI